MMHDTEFKYPGDGNRMPIYPIILSFFFRPNLPLEHFFALGKYINFVLSIIALIGIFLIFGYYLPLAQALALVGVTAFTVYLFRASYLHPDQLYYFLSFVAFILMAKMLLKPTVLLAAACGLVAALAHLTKASMLLGFALFVVFFCLRMAYHFFVSVKSDEQIPKSRNRFVYNLACMGVALLAFFAVLYPQISSNKRVFGRYFYNVNTTFYMWYDSWDEVKRGTRAHGDREGWPKMPPDQIPGPVKYWQEHTWREIGYRFLFGGAFTLLEATTSSGWFKYFLILPVVAVIGILTNRRTALQHVREDFWLVSFVLCYFVVYYLSYSWYGVIAADSRFVLSLFLPVAFSSALVINTMFDKSNPLVLFGKRVIVSRVWGPILLGAICLEVGWLAFSLLMGISKYDMFSAAARAFGHG